ncbi:MAG: response regulator [Campylobacterota bacterium]|nr:response regulator [Campylobacterota bacterium]
MSKIKVLIVEDDEVTATNLKLSLDKYDYDVVSITDNATQARSKIKIYNPNVIFIDISLQKSTDGIELAHYINENHKIPFIYLTSHTDSDIINQAKLTEPYGYIIKPFDPVNLHTTIVMALHRHSEEEKRHSNLSTLKHDKNNLEKLLYAKKVSDKPIVPFGSVYYLDISVCETFYENQKIKLTRKENAFIRLLVAQLGGVVTFDQVIKYVWDEGGATENSVRTLVWRLRNKLPTEIIKNASGVGYYIED